MHSMRTFKTTLLGLLILAAATLPMQAQPRRVWPERMQKTLTDKVKQETEKQYLKYLKDAFEYDDIIHALYRLDSFYKARAQQLQEEAKLNALQFQQHIEQPVVVAIRKPIGRENISKNPLLVAISKNTLTQEQLLEAISPLDPTKSNWENTYYAAMYVPQYLQTLTQRNKSTERDLRHLQMRLSLRISQLNRNAEAVAPIQYQAVGQLRIALMATHLAYKNIYGQDPLENFKPEYPYMRYLDEVVINGKSGKKNDTIPTHEKRPQYPDSPSVYQLEKNRFVQEIAYWKSKLPKDPYTFTKTAEALKSRNKTANLSFGEAAKDLACNFLFITAIKGLGEFIANTDNETVPLANLRALAPAAVEYDLLNNDLEHVKKIVQILEPEKLGENRYGGVFKNDALFQGIQPAIAEIFNTLYIYAVTPGRTPQEWTRLMNLLAEFTNPNQYSIITRLSALAVSAKILDIRNQALNPYSIQPNPDNTALARQHKLPNEYGNIAFAKPEHPLDYRQNIYYITTGKRPYQYQDYMARNIVDIYATLVADGTLSGMHDYGMSAKQMKELADQLARLYNIFVDAGTTQAYPRILSRGHENMEEIWGYNHNGIKEKQIHYFGARVKTSWGDTVDMFMDNPINKSKFDKDTGEFITQFAIDVVSWKFIVGSIRLGKSAIGATMRFITPKTTQLALQTGLETAKPGTSAFMTMQALLKEGATLSAEKAEHVKYILAHPVPEVTTRAEALKFLGLPADASKTQIKNKLNELRVLYHPDRFVSDDLLSAAGKKFANQQMANLNTIGTILTKPHSTVAVAAEEVAKQQETAAQTAVKRDPHSWGAVTRGFATFYAVDYLVSHANLPVEEHMSKRIQQEAEAYQPATYGDKQPNDAQPQDAPLYVLDAVAAKADPERQGSIVRLPINVLRQAFQSSLLGAEDRAMLSANTRLASYQHALNAGTVVAWQQSLQQRINDMESYKQQFIVNNAIYIDCLPAAKKELKGTFQTYIQTLKQIKSLAETDLEQAYKMYQASEEKLINSQADIMTRSVRAYTQKYLPLDIQNNQLTFQWQYAGMLQQGDLDQIQQILTRYYQAKEKAGIDFYTAQQRAKTQEEVLLLQQRAINEEKQALLRSQVQLQQLGNKLIKQINEQEKLIIDIKQEIEADVLKIYPKDIEQHPQLAYALDIIYQVFLLDMQDLLTKAPNEEVFRAGYQQLRQTRDAQWAEVLRKFEEGELQSGDLEDIF